MNFVGKIFIVLILVLSLFYMSLAVMVYAAHRDWPKEYAAQGDRLKTERDLNEKSQLEVSALKTKLNNEKIARQKTIKSLEEAIKIATNKNLEANVELVKAKKENEAQAAVLQTSTNHLKLLHIENDKLRLANKEQMNKTERLTGENVALTTDVHNAILDAIELRERTKVLTTQIAKWALSAKHKGINLDAPNDGPPKVEGVVTAVSKSGSVTISIGSDDGISLGDELIVYRTDAPSFIGKVLVEQVHSDRAVATVMKKFLKRRIQLDDVVTTRLRNTKKLAGK